MAQPLQWNRVLVEGLVIVTSILLAFAIDAGWQERQERVVEVEVLDGLRREFEEYRKVFVIGLAEHGEMMSAMEAILRSIDTGMWTSDEWDIDEAVWQTLIPGTSDLGNGVRDALVQSGRLELISDRALRERLAAWPRYFEELLDDQTVHRQMVFEQLIPYLTAAGFHLSTVFQFGVEWPVSPRSIAENPAALRRLIGDPEYRALIEVRFAFLDHTGGEYRSALAAADEILADLGRVQMR